MTTVSHEGFELRGEVTKLRSLLAHLWRSRDLIHMLSRKSFFVRYRRASFGMLWSVGLPIAQAAVLAVVFSRVVRIETEVSFPVFVFSGVLPWTFFNGSLGSAVTSIIDGGNLATKVYFPRAVFPIVVVGGNLYGLLPGLVVLIGMAALFGVPMGLHLLFLIPAMGLLLLLTTGFCLVLAALQVYFRDIRYILQAALFGWFYGSAVLFPVDQVPPGLLRQIFLANPATGMIQAFRIAIVDSATQFDVAVLWTIGWGIGLLLFAAFLYRRYDRTFVDLL